MDRILFWGTVADKSYLPNLKGCVGGASTHLRLSTVTTLTEVTMHCKKLDITGVITTSVPLLKKLLSWTKAKAPSLANYEGSLFKLGDIDIVFVSPLRQLVTMPRAKFMVTRYITKLTKPAKWYKPTAFQWQLLQPKNADDIFERYKDAFIIAVDIETFKENAVIRCLSYTALFYEPDGSLSSHTCVLPLDTDWALATMRKFNWSLKAGKVFANGKYDISYLSRYNAPIYNYLWDVQNAFHSWYSELPKDLGFLNSFFIRDAMYWKDLAETDDLMEYYRYNALDTWGTANTFIAWLLESPAWAKQNYLLEFPLVFPCHLSEMIGIKRDMDKLTIAVDMQKVIIEEKSKRLDRILGVTGFNVKSPIQMKALLRILGCGDLKKADETNLKKAKFRHPFNGLIIGLVLDIRKARTLIEKYLQTGEKAKEFKGRILYALNPHGTDSSRLASKEHHFWCGMQIQNIPRPDPTSNLKYSLPKSTLVADPGFAFAEADLEQAESRDTAYIAGEKQMIQNVEHSPDFHSANASSFFGIPFEELFSVADAKVLNKAIRDIAKNVNHGANYNMGWMILIDTMTEERVLLARKLLGLPSYWSLKQVAEYLLEQFHATYPDLRETFYPGIVSEIITTRMLKSRAVHYHTAHNTYEEELGWSGAWTRYCFGDPVKNKRALNSYISHPPQSLNAQTLNKGVLRVFNDIAMNPKYSPHFKLIAQVHDSILYQYRIGHDYLHDMVRERMEIPITIRGYDDVIRTFTVPASVKKGIEGKPALYWSETE